VGGTARAARPRCAASLDAADRGKVSGNRMSPAVKRMPEDALGIGGGFRYQIGDADPIPWTRSRRANGRMVILLGNPNAGNSHTSARCRVGWRLVVASAHKAEPACL
jgi:hypothetical protein